MNLNELNNLSKGGSDKVAEDSLGLGIVWKKNTDADWKKLEAINKRLAEIANNQQPVDNSFFGNVKTAIGFAAKPMSGQVEPIASMLNSAYEAFKPSGLYKKYMSSKDDVLREAKAISIETGIPENAILASHESLVAARDIKAYRDKQMKLAPAGQNDFSNEAIYKAYPELKNLSETDSAIALSDIENVLVSRSIIENIRRGYEIAMLGRRRSDLGVKKGWGGGLSAEEEKELAGIGDKISDVGEVIDASQDLLAGIAGKTTMQIPRLVRGGIKGQALGLAAAGAVAMGGFAITKNPTLSAAAAQRAYQVGSKYGMMEDMFQEMAGNYYLDFLDMKGDDGKQLLSDDLAIAGAVIVGGINTYAEFANYGAILNVLGGSGKQAVVKEIIANYKNNPALMQGLRQYAASASKSTAKALLMELGEEGVQDAVEKIAHNVIVSTARPNNYKTHSIGDIARGAVGAMYDAAPSAIGLGVLLNAGAASSNIRSMANAMRIRDENSRNELRTVALTSMTGDIVNNKQVKELYAKDPDIAKKVIKEQLPEEFKEVRIDTELLAEKDGGGEFLAAVAKNAGVGADELQATIENKAELVVPTEVYFQTRNEQSGSDYVDEHISANVDSVSTARRKQQAEQFQKEMESLLSEEGKAQVSLLDSIIESNFPQGDPNRDLAAGVIMTNPQNPSDGWKQAYAGVVGRINELLMPFVEKMKSEGGKGVSIAIMPDGDGRGTRVSNNPSWYRSLYARLGRAPTNTDYIAHAREILSDISTMEEFTTFASDGSPEEQAYFDNNKAELDSLFEQKKALDDIKGRISGLTTSEIGIAKGLSKEGYKLYKNVSDQLIQSDNKDVSKAGRMGAILLARHADRVAEIMQRSGKNNYTAMDYYKNLGIEASATNQTGGALNQKAMLAEQKLNADAQAWGDNIDAVFNGKIKNNSAIKMMQTPLVLQNIGLEDLPIVMHPSKLKKILKDHPEMSPDILKQIPEHMADPMAVFPSDTSIGNMVVALELTDNKDNNVIVPIELSASAGRYNANIATSAYGKESKKWFADSFENKKGQPLYLNNKKITNWYSANRRQLPYGNYQSSDFFDNSIYNENDLVKKKLLYPELYQSENSANSFNAQKQAIKDKYQNTDQYMKAPNGKQTNLTEDQWLTVRTKSFKNWFGDWENDPTSSSKVVDENGEPLVVYHGSNANFTEFRKYTSDDTNEGEIWFASNPKIADDYARNRTESLGGDEKLYAVFLDIKNPSLGSVAKDMSVISDYMSGNADTFYDLGIEPTKYKDTTRLAEVFANASDYGSSIDVMELFGFDGRALGDTYTVFQPNQIKSVDNIGTFNETGNIYNQGKKDARGSIGWNSEGRAIISLFSSADKSTFVHELGHLFLSDIKELAEMPDAPAWLKKDWETTKTFLGWKSGQTEFTTAQHEKFANSFVGYLMSGEAPIGGLKPVFRRFKQWLSKLYTDFIQLGGEPSKDIKAVMSRMIATQEEVDASIKLAGWKDFVKKGGTTFLDDKTSAMYDRWMDSAKEEAYEQTLRQAMQDYREQLDQDRQVMIDSERGRIQEELLSSVPAFLASEAVKQTGQEDVVLELGFSSVQEYRAALQEAGGTLENAVDDHMESFVRELDADTIDESKIREYAESAVKDSRYQELLRAAEYEALTKINADTNTKANGAIKKMEKAFKALTEETDQEKIQSLQDEVAQLKKELEYNYRWSIAERNLIQDIATAKHDDAVKQLKKIVKEKTTGVRVLRDEAIGTSQMYKDYAFNRLATMPLHQAIDHKQWLKLSNRRNQEFLAELAKGNYQQAQRIKREQLLYASMAAQADKNAKAVSKDLGKIKKRMGSMLSGNVQMPIDERYHYENLLRQFGIYSSSKPIPQPIDPKSLESVFAKYNEDKEIDLDNSDGDPNSSMLPAWITAVASGANMNSAVFSETGSRIISYNTLSMDEFKTLADVLNTIYTVGRDYNKTKSIVDAMGNKIELSQAVSDIVGSAIKNIRVSSAPDPYGVSGTTFGSAISGGIGRFNVMLLKPETIFDRIDGGIHGFAQKYLYDPLNKSMNTERAMQANVGRQLEEALDLYSGVELAQLRYRKSYKFLGQSVTRETIISLALNWGTEINRKRIMDGFNISERDVNNALAQLDSKDWEFTARVWGIVGQYWNETVALEERMTGTTLVKQEAIPFVIKGNDGQEYSMAGGYYPIAYNSEKSSRAADLKQDDIAKSNMSGNSVFGTRRGHTKSRTAQAVNRPVLLSFDVMTKHMDDVIHNIAFRESLRDVNRIINSKEMQALLDDERYFGVATNQMLKQWVKDNWKQESATNFGEKVAEIARKNQVIATLGYSVSTAVLNILNLFPMMYELGPIDALSAIKNFAAKPMDNYSFVIEKSSMMRNRAQSMDAAAREIMKEKLPSIQNNMLTKNAFWLQAKTDEMLSMPLWFASYKEAYNSELKKLQGFDMVVDADALARVDQMAITLADKAVRRVFGSGDVKDLSAVQRSNAFIKMLTPYYSYFNTVYNAIARRHYAAKDSGWALKQTTQLAYAYLMWIILQSVAESLLREALKSDDERKKDKRKWHVKLAHSSIDNSVGSIPVFRDVVAKSTAYIFDGGRNASLRSPTFMEAINRAERVMQTVSQIQGANRANKDWIDFLKESNRVGNSVFGVPDALTDSVWTTARWIDSDFDQGISEYLRALLFKKKLNK